MAKVSLEFTTEELHKVTTLSPKERQLLGTRTDHCHTLSPKGSVRAF
jgi:hypothetical protein